MKKDGLFLGGLLILIGSLWLLGNLGLISFSIYDLGTYIRRVIELWPIVLIIVGTNMITDSSAVRNTVLALCLLLVVVYIAYYQQINALF
ncbi:hypothetical protein EUAN_15850 [Andreesenia angusta]|uniref:LiaI-LiaF-like transmembrane region domain-containing protein n=1 Tax=Andreesenia angusta TaxID=39480 RepID=A0A1S1V7K3_9FIRM|nr:DUF5668 domain-containing protein [Andreesenia angusta]OHW62137.1 hypothetical protein EUAN_15850 [Andreesenia angusta]